MSLTIEQIRGILGPRPKLTDLYRPFEDYNKLWDTLDAILNWMADEEYRAWEDYMGEDL